MASDSPMSSQPSTVEFEDIEMTQLDADTLRKLLEEEPDSEVQEGGGGCVIQPMAVKIDPAGWTKGSDGSGPEKEEDLVSNEFEWLDMTEMSPAPPCTEEVAGEMLDMGEYDLDYFYYYQLYNNNNTNAVLVEETAYEEGLWQNSY